MSLPDAVRAYKQRAAMVEPVFADLFQRQGFRRFRRAGIRGASLETALHLSAHNLNRLLDLLGRAGKNPLEALLAALGLLSALWTAVVVNRGREAAGRRTAEMARSISRADGCPRLRSVA